MRLSDYDADQIVKFTFDEKLGATKVNIVGGENISMTANMKPLEDKLTELVELQRKYNPQIGSLDNNRWPDVLEKNVFIDRIQTVEKPIIVTEYKTIEVPKVIQEVVYKEIQVPIIVKELEVQKVEVPIIVYKEKDSKGLPLFLKVCMLIQALGTIGIMVANFVKLK